MTVLSRGASALGEQKTIAVAGLGVTGRAVSSVLLGLGFRVVALEAAPDTGTPAVADLLKRGLRIETSDLDFDAAGRWLRDQEVTLVIASPGWKPASAVLRAALDAEVPVWSEVELAWRLRPSEHAPWLVVTGTNGKTTTVRMLKHVLRAGGLRAQAVGNIGRPLILAALDPNLDMLAVELSSFQLHYTYTVEPLASAVLNIAPDHIDWHGSFDDYVAAKARVYDRTQKVCLYSVSDPRTEEVLRNADVADGARAIGIGLGVPQLGTLGIVEDRLYDRAFFAARRTEARELAGLADLGASPRDTQVSAALATDALFAAGLALAAGVGPEGISRGLRDFTADTQSVKHRGETVGVLDGIQFINNSKATNPHAARSAFSAFTARKSGKVVWILGGQTKGADLEPLVAAVLPRLRAAVLIGADREEIRDIFSRHAPDLPVIEIAAPQTGSVSQVENSGVVSGSAAIMDRAVAAAVSLAVADDAVLLAPACASLDQFSSFGDRGDAFVSAVLNLSEQQGAIS